MREFIAVELDDEVRRALTAFVDELRTAGANVKWVEPANLHVTLKFLGDIDERDTPAICRLMDEAVAGERPFLLTVSGAGRFPPRRAPRTIWAGASEEDGTLVRIHGRLDQSLQALSVAPDRRGYTAHVTLGRVRAPRGADRLVQMIEAAADRPFGACQVDGLRLFESRLDRSGSTYLPLYRAGFR